MFLQQQNLEWRFGLKNPLYFGSSVASKTNYFCKLDIPFWWKIWTQVDFKHFIPVYEIFQKIHKNDITCILYVFLSFDFCGTGKKSAHKAMMQNAKHFQRLCELGLGPPTKAQQLVCTKFVGLWMVKSNVIHLMKSDARKRCYCMVKSNVIHLMKSDARKRCILLLVTLTRPLAQN